MKVLRITIISLLVALSLAVVLPISATEAQASGPITIDFNDLADQQFVGTHYPGLTFSPEWRAADHMTGKYNTAGYPPHSWPIQIWTGAYGEPEPWSNTGRIDFDFEVSQVGGWFCADYGTVYLEAYDAGGALVASNSLGPNYGSNSYLSVSDSQGGIKYVIIHDASNYWSVDNLEYTPAVGIRITQPNGGESWAIGSSQSIKWTSSGIVGNINIFLSRDGGTSWENIIPETSNDGSESWLIVGPPTTLAMTKIASANDPAVFDISDGTFAISARPSAPNESIEQIRGVDISEYSGEVPVDSWQRLKVEGWDFAIVGAWGGRGKNDFAESQLSAARQAGLKTAAYALLNFDRTDESGSYQIDQALMAIGAEKSYLAFLAIDVERAWPVKVDATQRITEAIERVKSAGLRPIIYTSRGAWQSITGNSLAFSELPLWDTDWDQKSSLQEIWRSYGGWTNRVGKQYGHDLWIGEKPWQVWADLNVFDASLFGFAPP
jgi:GH25 family lysozyme M1 (1,4-beta-N-acetylmuramidase)